MSRSGTTPSTSLRLLARFIQIEFNKIGAVAQAYRLPRETEAERQDRSASISSALADAARPPADVVRTALLLISLAEELLPAGNRNMITDLARRGRGGAGRRGHRAALHRDQPEGDH